MEIRPLEPPELSRFVDRLWLPFMESTTSRTQSRQLATNARALHLDYRADRLRDDSKRTFVAATDRTLVGFVSVECSSLPPIFTGDCTVNVSELFVREQYRRTGIASSLMEKAEQWGNERDCDRIALSVEADNDSARGFYRERDFQTEKYRLSLSLD